VDIVRTASKAPFLLTSSEKLTPELRIRVDGAVTEALMVNGLFAAVPIAAGEHEIRFERRIGRGFWPLGAAGVVLILSGVIADVRHRRGRATRTN
jgi:hypothetical protein